MKTCPWKPFANVAVSLALSCSCVGAAAAQPPVIARIGDTAVHAIVNPVMFGFADTRFKDSMGNEEMAIRRKVKLAQPKRKLTLLVEGILQAKDPSGRHANPGQTWTGLRCSYIKSEEARRGPLAIALPIPSPGLQLNVLGLAGNKFTISIADLMAGKQIDKARLIKSSSRQARLMFTVESTTDIAALEFDTTGLDPTFLGLLRAHVMCEPETTVSVVFEDYGPEGDYESAVRTLSRPAMTYVELSNTCPSAIERETYRWHG